jgi:hypothetical protein
MARSGPASAICAFARSRTRWTSLRRKSCSRHSATRSGLMLNRPRFEAVWGWRGWGGARADLAGSDRLDALSGTMCAGVHGVRGVHVDAHLRCAEMGLGEGGGGDSCARKRRMAGVCGLVTGPHGGPRVLCAPAGDGRRFTGFSRKALPPAPRVGCKLRFPEVLCIIAEYPWFSFYFKAGRGHGGGAAGPAPPPPRARGSWPPPPLHSR